MPVARSLLIVGAVAIVAAIIVLLSFERSDRDGLTNDEGSRESEPGESPTPSNLTTEVIEQGHLPSKLPSKRLTAELPERFPEEELWSMVPDQHALNEIQRWDFRIQGGIESPGTDPARARREVDDSEWSAQFAEELEEGLREKVLTNGVTLDRIECDRGRCLVEMGYNGMERAFERVDSLRDWLEQDVRCRGYTDGPIEGDAPSVLPTQQVWILCGEPESSRYSQ